MQLSAIYLTRTLVQAALIDTGSTLSLLRIEKVYAKYMQRLSMRCMAIITDDKITKIKK